MNIRELMTTDIQKVAPTDTVQQAASFMLSADTGSIPVCDGDKIVGMITDRDICVRGVALGKGPDDKVADVMSREVKYCFEDDDSDAVLRNMGDIQVRRLPVLNRDKRLIGIVSLADLASIGQTSRTGEALGGIVRPGGEHSQSVH